MGAMQHRRNGDSPTTRRVAFTDRDGHQWLFDRTIDHQGVHLTCYSPLSGMVVAYLLNPEIQFEAWVLMGVADLMGVTMDATTVQPVQA